MRAIAARRAAGEIPADAAISTARMARIAVEIGQPVSEATFRRIEDRALTKIRLAILAYAATQPND
jgi:hypothetical protein